MIAAGTLLELVERNAAEYADLPATVDGPQQLTWSRYRERARSVALALIDLGVRPGQVVGLHMANRAEHVVSDVGALYAGTTPTTFYNTLSAAFLGDRLISSPRNRRGTRGRPITARISTRWASPCSTCSRADVPLIVPPPSRSSWRTLKIRCPPDWN